MSTPRSSARLLLTIASTTALLLAGCSGSERMGGTNPGAPKDAGTGGDGGTSGGGDGSTGTPDGGGVTGCGMNPNMCALNQLKAAPPECTCLDACASGFQWNAGTRRCDPTGGTDGGVGGDGGMMGPECRMNADCPGANAACLDTQSANQCTGQQTCGCFNTCDPYAATSGCMPAEGCFWLGTMSAVEGICGPDQGGGTQGQACTAMFDPAGNIQGDSCNFSQSFLCIGASPENPTGVCGRLCHPTRNPTLCMTLGNYQCDDLDDPTPSVGLCLEPRPTFTDIGNDCMTPPNCQSTYCSMILASSCSAQCGGLRGCPTGSVCVNAGPEGPICARECTPGTAGDGDCSGRNMRTICQDFGQPGMPFGLCIPRCAMDADCGAGGTCNMATGHCNP